MENRGRPKGRNRKQIGVSLPKSMIEAIDLAVKRGIAKNRSEFVENIIHTNLSLNNKELEKVFWERYFAVRETFEGLRKLKQIPFIPKGRPSNLDYIRHRSALKRLKVI